MVEHLSQPPFRPKFEDCCLVLEVEATVSHFEAADCLRFIPDLKHLLKGPCACQGSLGRIQGYLDAYLTCPADGTTWETVKKWEPQLAALLDLPRGGGVTVLPDLDRGARAVQVDVMETDALATPVPYPTGTADDDEEW